MTIHPKASAAGLGGALGTVLVSVLASIHGVHLTAEANAAIPAFLAALGAYLSPDGQSSPAPAKPPAPSPSGPAAVDVAVLQAKVP